MSNRRRTYSGEEDDMGRYVIFSDKIYDTKSMEFLNIDLDFSCSDVRSDYSEYNCGCYVTRYKDILCITHKVNVNFDSIDKTSSTIDEVIGTNAEDLVYYDVSTDLTTGLEWINRSEIIDLSTGSKLYSGNGYICIDSSTGDYYLFSNVYSDYTNIYVFRLDNSFKIISKTKLSYSSGLLDRMTISYINNGIAIGTGPNEAVYDSNAEPSHYVGTGKFHKLDLVNGGSIETSLLTFTKLNGGTGIYSELYGARTNYLV